MAGSENGENVETVESKAPLLWIFFLAMGLVTLTALGDEIFDYIGTDQERTTTESYYQSKCHEIETSGFPSFAVNEYKDHGNSGADWGKNYPPYCALAAQYFSANSAALSAFWNKWMLFLTVVGVMLLWRTLILTRKTLTEAEAATKAAQKTASITQKVGQDQIRAHLVVNNPLSRSNPYYFHDKKILYVYMQIEVENCGLTPARNINIIHDLFEGSDIFELYIGKSVGVISPNMKKNIELCLFVSEVDKTEDGDDLIRQISNNISCINLKIDFDDVFHKRWSLVGEYDNNSVSSGVCEIKRLREYEVEYHNPPYNPLLDRPEPKLSSIFIEEILKKFDSYVNR